MQSSVEALDGASNGLIQCSSFSEDQNLNLNDNQNITENSESSGGDQLVALVIMDDRPEAMSSTCTNDDQVLLQFVDIHPHEKEPVSEGPEVYCISELAEQESELTEQESELNLEEVCQSPRTDSTVQFNQSSIISNIPVLYANQNGSSEMQHFVCNSQSTADANNISVDRNVVQDNPVTDCEPIVKTQESNQVINFYSVMDTCQQENETVGDQHELSRVIFATTTEQPQVIFTKASEGSKVASIRSLEDYMDVVTTYQCKFCRFSCQWKSGLMSHIRNCHLTNQMTTAKKLSTGKDSGSVSQSSSFKNIENDNVDTVELVRVAHTGNVAHDLVDKHNETGKANEEFERHIYLCGECSGEFYTLKQCKAHMVKDHKVNLFEPSSKVKKHSKRKVKKPNQNFQQSDEVSYDKKNKDEDIPTPTPNLYVEQSNDKVPVSDDQDLEPGISLEDEPKKRKERKNSTGERVYKCGEPGCTCRFLSESNLEYHSQCHLSEEGKPFGCPECTEKFEQWRHLLTHLWKEHLIDLDLCTCLQCGYKTCSQFKLNIHMKIHSEARDYMCHTCGKSFKQHSQLRNHSVIHLDREVKRTGQKRWYSMQECDICQRTFSDSKSLCKHKQAVHCKIKPYVCSFCGHTSARKAMLQLHMRQHTGEKPYSCEHCDYKTGDHNSLRRHRMRHTGSKPYKCSHCNYACIQAISLKTHLKNKHPGLEGLHACSLCSFRSVSKENFVNHMADHNRGVLPISFNQKRSNIGDETPQLHLPEGSTQLEGMTLPGNMISAQLICSCLNALTKDGETIDLPPGVITSTSDGTQTITIQIPANADEETGEQYYFTIQQAVASNDLNSPTTELGLMDSAELKLGGNEPMNVNDYISSDTVSGLLQEGEC